jgi:hypothetical protein
LPWIFFLLSFGFRVGRLQVRGKVFFPNVFGVESGLYRVDIGLSMQVLLGFGRGGGRGGFIFLSTNKRAQGALLLFLLS